MNSFQPNLLSYQPVYFGPPHNLSSLSVRQLQQIIPYLTGQCHANKIEDLMINEIFSIIRFDQTLVWARDFFNLILTSAEGGSDHCIVACYNLLFLHLLHNSEGFDSFSKNLITALNHTLGSSLSSEPKLQVIHQLLNTVSFPILANLLIILSHLSAVICRKVPLLKLHRSYEGMLLQIKMKNVYFKLTPMNSTTLIALKKDFGNLPEAEIQQIMPSLIELFSLFFTFNERPRLETRKLSDYEIALAKFYLNTHTDSTHFIYQDAFLNFLDALILIYSGTVEKTAVSFESLVNILPKLLCEKSLGPLRALLLNSFLVFGDRCLNKIEFFAYLCESGVDTHLKVDRVANQNLENCLNNSAVNWPVKKGVHEKKSFPILPVTSSPHQEPKIFLKIQVKEKGALNNLIYELRQLLLSENFDNKAILTNFCHIFAHCKHNAVSLTVREVFGELWEELAEEEALELGKNLIKAFLTSSSHLQALDIFQVMIADKKISNEFLLNLFYKLNASCKFKQYNMELNAKLTQVTEDMISRLEGTDNRDSVEWLREIQETYHILNTGDHHILNDELQVKLWLSLIKNPHLPSRLASRLLFTKSKVLSRYTDNQEIYGLIKNQCKEFCRKKQLSEVIKLLELYNLLNLTFLEELLMEVDVRDPHCLSFLELFPSLLFPQAESEESQSTCLTLLKLCCQQLPSNLLRVAFLLDKLNTFFIKNSSPLVPFKVQICEHLFQAGFIKKALKLRVQIFQEAHNQGPPTIRFSIPESISSPGEIYTLLRFKSKFNLAAEEMEKLAERIAEQLIGLKRHMQLSQKSKTELEKNLVWLASCLKSNASRHEVLFKLLAKIPELAIDIDLISFLSENCLWFFLIHFLQSEPIETFQHIIDQLISKTFKSPCENEGILNFSFRLMELNKDQLKTFNQLAQMQLFLKDQKLNQEQTSIIVNCFNSLLNLEENVKAQQLIKIIEKNDWMLDIFLKMKLQFSAFSLETYHKGGHPIGETEKKAILKNINNFLFSSDIAIREKAIFKALSLNSDPNFGVCFNQAATWLAVLKQGEERSSIHPKITPAEHQQIVSGLLKLPVPLTGSSDDCLAVYLFMLEAEEINQNLQMEIIKNSSKLLDFFEELQPKHRYMGSLEVCKKVLSISVKLKNSGCTEKIDLFDIIEKSKRMVYTYLIDNGTKEQKIEFLSTYIQFLLDCNEPTYLKVIGRYLDEYQEFLVESYKKIPANYHNDLVKKFNEMLYQINQFVKECEATKRRVSNAIRNNEIKGIELTVALKEIRENEREINEIDKALVDFMDEHFIPLLDVPAIVIYFSRIASKGNTFKDNLRWLDCHLHGSLINIAKSKRARKMTQSRKDEYKEAVDCLIDHFVKVELYDNALNICKWPCLEILYTPIENKNRFQVKSKEIKEAREKRNLK